ncbi:MAG TPA: hypothetical protein VMT47_12630, partial [Polyangia bacterium]|nr:hypothetical protein [Polyangia bacterium]
NYGVAEATAAAASNIDIYTLAFATSPLTAESTRWFNYAGSLVRGRGFALNTIDPTTLTAQLLKISNSLQVALVQ